MKLKRIWRGWGLSSDWLLARLGGYCQKIGSGATPRGGSSVYLDEGPVSFIRSQNVYNEGFKVGGLTYIDENAADKLKNVIVEADDVLLNITGDSVARVCLAPKQYLPARVNQHVAIIRPDPNEFDSRFIRYYLIAPAMQSYLFALAGSGATRNALTKGMIEGLEIPKPEISVQREIADVLSSLDNKIELNRQINQNLDQIAQAIFKSWFVDFEPVKAKIQAKQNGQDPERAAMRAISGKTDEEFDHLSLGQKQKLAATSALFPDELEESEIGEIPKGWSVRNMGDLAEKITKGTTPRKPDVLNAEDPAVISFIKVKDITGDGQIIRNSLESIPASIHENSLKRSILKTDDLLFSIAGTIGRVSLVEADLDNSNTNQAVAFIRLKDHKNHLELCHQVLRSRRTQDEIASKVVQGVQANASLANIGDITVIVPDQAVLNIWNQTIQPITTEGRSLSGQIRTVSQIRDSLLPKLLSGEISLNIDNQEMEIA